MVPEADVASVAPVVPVAPMLAETVVTPGPEIAADPRSGRWSASFRPHPGRLVTSLALVLSLVFLATSVFMWRSADARRALAGDQVAASSAASRDIEKMLGYDYQSFDQHTSQVSTLLTGPFRNEFVKAATAVVKPLAVQNRAMVVAKVSKVAVMSSPGQGDVKILLFVDQRTTSAKLQRPQIDQNRVMLTMSQVRGRWLVSRIEAF